MGKPLESPHIDYGPFTTAGIFIAGLLIGAFRYLSGLGHRLSMLEDWRKSKDQSDAELKALIQSTHDVANETKGKVEVILAQIQQLKR